MKKIITILATLSILFSSFAPVFAMDGSESARRPLKDERIASREAMVQEKTALRSEKLNDRAVAEITRRIDSLNKLITRIGAIKRLSADQKASFITQIQTEITNLQKLEAKIKTDTDPVILKTDVQSIIKSYRVYLLFIPKIELIAAADRMSTVADEMSSYSAKLKTRIDGSKAAGNDVSSLQTLLDDMNAKIADAKTQATDAIDTVLPLTPDGYPANASILQSARKMIQAGRLDLVTALQDGQKIRHGLKDFDKDKTGSNSAEATKGPTPTGD